jgi:hypothetical protein
MQVTLRIVGLFFNKKVIIPDVTTNTVEDVMEAYINAGNSDIAIPGGLSYLDDLRGTLNEISFHYEGTYDFNPNNATPPQNQTLQGKTLPAGKRTLRELRVDANVILGWQYYVISKRGTNKSKTKQAQGFTPYGVNPPLTYNIVEGDTIVWRLVAINLTEKESVYEYPTY